MLKRFLSELSARRAVRNAHAVGAMEPHAELARRYDEAAAHWSAGRIAEAAAACKALLEIEPNHLRAHKLLATIELPGESYFRVLERVHAHLRPRTYVEIGVARGDSIRLAGPDTRAIGVDPEPRIEVPLGPNVSIMAETSDELFARHDVRALLGGLPVELAFIDGMHHFEFALRDFVNLEPLCASSATILIHDVYPLDERTAARERTTTFWTGDLWRLIVLLREQRPELMVHTIAAEPTGLALVRNLDPRSTLLRDRLEELIAQYLALDYRVLDGRKAQALALFPNDWSQVRALLDAPVARGQ